MYQLFESHIRGILDERKPKTILEIGVLRGDSTLKLLEWCAANQAHLTSLDPVAWEGQLPDDVKRPMPGYEYKRGQEGFEDWSITPSALEEVYKMGLDRHWTCLKTRSLDYLDSEEFDGFDVYIIDGDHNYYTVYRELELIHRKYKPADMVLFNDVSGSWARRDLYYDPEFIPPEFLNGRKQGVLPAINAFLDAHSHKKLWWRTDCPFRFRIITKKHNGLGLLTQAK